MSGKSTFMRTVSLLLLMAHCGMSVPCAEMKTVLLKNILCRIGGYDFGNSTFQTEMTDC